MSRYSRAALVASSAVLLGLSVGCAESGQPPVAPPPSAPSAPKEAPTGQSRPGRFEGRNMSFDYPPRWRVAEETSVPGVEIQIENPRGRAGVEPTVSALSDRGFRESFEALVNLFELGPISAVPNRKVLARRPVRVEGAQEALLIDQRGTQYVRDGRAVAPEEVRDGDEPVTLRQWTVLALGPGGVNVSHGRARRGVPRQPTRVSAHRRLAEAPAVSVIRGAVAGALTMVAVQVPLAGGAFLFLIYGLEDVRPGAYLAVLLLAAFLGALAGGAVGGWQARVGGVRSRGRIALRGLLGRCAEPRP